MMFWSPDWRWDSSDLEEEDSLSGDGDEDESSWHNKIQQQAEEEARCATGTEEALQQQQQHPAAPPEAPHFLIHILAGRFDGCLVPRGAGGTTGSTAMPAALWSKLPAEVVEMVLAAVPPASRFRFQAVCRRWRALISSRAFLERCAARGRPNSVPVVGSIEYRPGMAGRRTRPHSDISRRMMLNGVAGSGTKVSLGFLPSKFRLFSDYVTQDGLACIIKPAQRRALARTVRASTLETAAAKQVVATGGGGGSLVSSISFCVVNPVTRTWQEVPPEFGPDDIYTRDWSVKLVVVAGDGGEGGSGNGGSLWSGFFKLVVMSQRAFQGDPRDRRLTASIYCSRTRRWTLVPLLDHNQQQQQHHHGNSNPHWPRHLLCNGLMYVARSFTHLVVYRVSDGQVVRRVTEADSRARAADERYDDMGDVCEVLAHPSGDVFCVAEAPARDTMRLEIWRLDDATLVWDRVAVLPDGIHRDLEEASVLSLAVALDGGDGAATEETDWSKEEEPVKYFLVEAAVVDDSICLTIGVKVQRVRNWFHTHVVAYHVAREAWQVVCCGLDYDFHGVPYSIFTPSFAVIPP